jgi:SAM-dependent methyltransferase
MLPKPSAPGWISALAEHLPAPAPWTPGTHDIWDDSRLAPQMLATHLDPETDAASRRPETIDASVAWIADLLPDGARILDLGCGPGLYAERLARRGFAVTGVDRSPTSLAHARGVAEEQGLPIAYVDGDYLDVEVSERFEAVMLVFYDLGALGPDDTDTLLRRVRDWLTDDGIFVFDVLTPESREEVDEARWGAEVGGFWAPEPHLWLESTHAYESWSLHLDQTIVVTERDAPRVYRVWERCYTPEAVTSVLDRAGLAVTAMVGDLTGSPLGDATTSLGVVARRQSEGRAT